MQSESGEARESVNPLPAWAPIHKKKKLLEKFLEKFLEKLLEKLLEHTKEKRAFLVLGFQSRFTRTKNDVF